jgi:hypothetical protein
MRSETGNSSIPCIDYFKMETRTKMTQVLTNFVLTIDIPIKKIQISEQKRNCLVRFIDQHYFIFI